MFNDWQIFVPAVLGLFENIIGVSYFVSDWTKLSDKLGLCHKLLFVFISYLNIDETGGRQVPKTSLLRQMK